MRPVVLAVALLTSCAHMPPAVTAARCAAASPSLEHVLELDPAEAKAAVERIKVAIAAHEMPALEDVALALAAAQAAADVAECIDR